MDLDRFNRLLLESAGVGLALADPESLTIAFANPRFREWFPGQESAAPRLDELLTGLDVERMRSRLADERPYRTELELKLNRRAMTIAVDVKHHEGGGTDLLVVECQNVTKLKELEYMVESYSKMVERQNRDLRKEKERVEKLLLNIMPRSVFEEMRDYGTATPQSFEAASILMLDFVGFTDMAISRDPSALVSELNDIFSAFDRIVEMFGCERLRTIGDAYMAVSGVPEAAPDHAHNIARAALRMRRYLERRNVAHPQQWVPRIGINTGAVIGSLVGVQKYVYDLFGPGVNLAARMEAVSEPMRITLTRDTYELLKDDFSFEERGEFEIKGFGVQELYFLEGEYGDRF
jgi:adenylate cyclase